MNTPPHHPTRLIGNIAALVLVTLGVAYLFDTVARWSGHPTYAFCSAVDFFAPISFSIGVVLATVGVLVWVISAVARFHGGAGGGLVIGGFILTVLPNVMPHYFGWVCLPAP